jgi:hypothetical protein
VSYYLLRPLALTGLTWDLRQPPSAVVDVPRRILLEDSFEQAGAA